MAKFIEFDHPLLINVSYLSIITQSERGGECVIFVIQPLKPERIFEIMRKFYLLIEDVGAAA
jgi:hypothetical protein